MSVKEKRFKGFIAVLLGLFVVAELPFARQWVAEQGSVAAASRDFWNNLGHSPLYQVTAIDLTGVATLLFLWMVLDSRRRQHPWRAWLWLPLFLFSPSLGAFGYLLTRRGWEVPSVLSERLPLGVSAPAVSASGLSAPPRPEVGR